VIHQEAYPAIWRAVDAQNSDIPGAIPQNRRKPVSDQAKPPCKISRRSVAEKSVTVHTRKLNSKLSIPPYTTYGGIMNNKS